MTYGWGVYQNEGAAHVIPVDEAEQHAYSGCPCHPWEDVHGTIVHQSFDGREKFETGERKPS